jgi:thiol-disulfide isomerase/thioredoxin
MEIESKHIQAPELYGNHWLNSEPVSIRESENRVTLLDFWDYSCTNCLRALPYVKDWHRKYAEFGLSVVGVHTPEFHFASDIENVRKAAERLTISYPIVLDNDALIWSAYGVRIWPTRILVDKDGIIRFIQHGEGGYLEFERALQQLLVEAGCHGELPDLTTPLRDEDRPGVVCYRPTGEIYLGYLRGAMGNPEGYNPESTIEYSDPGIYLSDRFYASGKWMNERECLRFDGEGNERGTIILPYQAQEVNAVMGSRDGSKCEVTLDHDNLPLVQGAQGDDVVKSPADITSVVVDAPRMYQLVKNKDFGSHLLKLRASNLNLEIYSFAFTTGVIPELISTN